MCAYYKYHYNNLNHLSKKNISIEYIKFDILNEFVKEFTDIQILFLSKKYLKSKFKYMFPLRFHLSGKKNVICTADIQH